MHFAPIGLCDLVRRIDAGTLSVAQSLRQSNERIDQVDEAVRAFVERATPAMIERGASQSGPLRGVALGVKDLFDTAELPTTYGSPIYRGFQPRSDAAIVAMARRAGATVAGKTATTEFAFLAPSATGNPSNLEHTPGGSSSGSAAAVASGMVPVALGTQTAGSVIRPAAFCGVAGYKPSFRVLPATGAKPFAWTLDTVGIFARGVADAALFAELATGRTLRVAPDSAPSRLRVGLYRSAEDRRLDAEMSAAVDTAGRLLEKGGASLVDIAETDALAKGREAQGEIQLYEGAVSLMHEHREHRDELTPLLAEALDRGARVTPSRYDEARRSARQARRAIQPFFDEVDILLAPSALGAAPAGLASTGDPVMNRLWTVCGVPCVNVPGFRDSGGMPLGLSVVGRFGNDPLVLAAADRLEHLIR